IQVAKWDERLRQNGKDLGDLADRTNRANMEQLEQERALDAVAAGQRDLDRTLEELENEVHRLLSNTQGRVPEDADYERERTLELAVHVDRQLGHMLGSLTDVVKGLNEGFDRQADPNDTAVVKILNAHHHSLHWLETNAKRVEMELASVARHIRDVNLS
ncbi:unnamed protein product, partial [Phaeothamnion confervicola]